MAEFKYEIVENLGILSDNGKGWTKELNLVSWNEREPKYDIRDWNDDHSRMRKGITLTSEEAEVLKNILIDEFNK
ncbi:MAG: PC4/YdbC family ssDNA-binding protein [Anaerococcus sp.]|nr:PC4/YdbC family ssDNA-binding protein [Anaerococcus sp.]MDD7044002.1 PC4/YdbC family ssDNA-binding protein [Peptoniphilaceae bacterium]MDY2919590.1 PC4/YdbC family ssDNA-binding protein [Anaerococcus sp.]